MSPNSADAAVHEIYYRLIEAWNERDADAYAALFAPDGTMIGFDGTQASAAEIVGHIGPVFADHPTGGSVT